MSTVDISDEIRLVNGYHSMDRSGLDKEQQQVRADNSVSFSSSMECGMI